MKFQDLLENISHTHAELQIKAVQSVNQALTNSPDTVCRICASLTHKFQNTDNQEIDYTRLLLQRVSFTHLAVLMTIDHCAMHCPRKATTLPTEEELQHFILKELKKR